jgi:thiol-disulfide isomerase/thioredoxin
MKRGPIIVIAVSLISMFAGFILFQLSGSVLGPSTPASSEFQSAQPPPEKPVAPQSLVSVPFIDLQGKTHLLGDMKQPILVVNFWAPWCVPCRREVPDLITLQQEFGDRIQVLGLAFDSVENIESFAEEYQMNYPSYLANQHIPMYSSVFKNSSGALPFTAIVNHDREIEYTHTGIVNLQTLRQEVTKLF